MDNPYKLRRGGGKLPRSREGAPQVRVEYRRGTPLPPELFDPTVRPQMAPRADHNQQAHVLAHFVHLSLNDSISDESLSRKDGTCGNAVSLRTNLLKLDYPEDLVLYDYRIKIEPDISHFDKNVRRMLFCLFERSKELAPFVRGIAHDGARRIISGRLLPPDLTATIQFCEEDGSSEQKLENQEYTFHLLSCMELRVVDLSRYLRGDDPLYNPQPIVSAFNLIIDAAAAQIGIQMKGRGPYLSLPTLFVPPECTTVPGANLKGRGNFSATVIILNNSLMVNVIIGLDVSHIPAARLSDVLIAYSNLSDNKTDPLTVCNGTNVTTRHLGHKRPVIVKGFGPTTSRETLINVESLAERFTVEQYFNLKYGILLEHPDDLPVVQIDTGDDDVIIPAELCQIDSGEYSFKALSRNVDPVVARGILKSSSTAKEERNMSMSGIRMFGLCQNVQPMANFGLKSRPGTVTVQACILPPPRLFYQSHLPVIAKGSWRAQAVRFVKPAKLTNLVALVLLENGSENYYDTIELKLRSIIMNFVARCQTFGMHFGTAFPSLHLLTLPPTRYEDTSPGKILKAIEQKLSSFSEKPDLILAFFPKRDLQACSALRLICDIKVGIPCLCISIPKIFRTNGRNRCFSSLAMKLNTMLGGLNHMIPPRSLHWLKYTMLVGMALTHPSPGCLKRKSSIATIVATHDMDFVHYPASFSFQVCNRGMIADTKRMMIERLEEYRREMKDLPRRVVIFRRGISDSQIQQVLASEISGIRAAFRNFKNYKPKLTFIICTRGHRLRFYPTEDHNTDIPTHLEAGAVVDRVMSTSCYSSFYLHSHGTAESATRATCYTVVIDESSFSADALQQGINDLTYLWPLAPKSVSLVPPAYLAYRACQRAMLYFHETMTLAREKELAGMNGNETGGEARNHSEIRIHTEIKRTMFYL